MAILVLHRVHAHSNASVPASAATLLGHDDVPFRAVHFQGFLHGVRFSIGREWCEEGGTASSCARCWWRRGLGDGGSGEEQAFASQKTI